MIPPEKLKGETELYQIRRPNDSYRLTYPKSR